MNPLPAAYLCLLFPLITGTSADVPVGHLQPLGSHRQPDNNLFDETNEWPSPEEFWNKYVKPSRPLILRGAAKYSKAFTEWTDEYLSSKYGDLELRLEGKKEKGTGIPIGAKGIGRDTLGTLFIKVFTFLK
jgi:hypothetical protein